MSEFNDDCDNDWEEEMEAEMWSQAQISVGEHESEDAEHSGDNSQADYADGEQDAEHAEAWTQKCRRRKRNRHTTQRVQKRHRTSTGTCVKPLAEMDCLVQEFHDEWNGEEEEEEAEMWGREPEEE